MSENLKFLKFCKHCKHLHESPNNAPLCHHKRAYIAATYDLVTGSMVAPSKYLPCRTMRNRESMCGEAGNLWEQKWDCD